jgi:hypothetical protein
LRIFRIEKTGTGKNSTANDRYLSSSDRLHLRPPRLYHRLYEYWDDPVNGGSDQIIKGYKDLLLDKNLPAEIMSEQGKKCTPQSSLSSLSSAGVVDSDKDSSGASGLGYAAVLGLLVLALA